MCCEPGRPCKLRDDVEHTGLKTHPAPWRGQLLLACGKCQRKLKRGKDTHRLGKLKKALGKRAKAAGNPVVLLIINTRCLKICPRDGVAVCTQAQIGLGLCSILRSGTDADLLYSQIVADGAKT